MRIKYVLVAVIFLVSLLSLVNLSNKETQFSFNKNKSSITPTFPTTSVMANSGTEQNNSSKPSLNANQGEEIGFIYEAFLRRQQEPGEEEDTPSTTPKQFKSTAPSVPRNQRKSRGHAILRFTKDLSKVYVDVKVEGVKVEDVTMFHIHCGKPDMLGPILVDFALSGDIQNNLSDGILSVELVNEDIEKVVTSKHKHSIVAAFTLGCPIVPGTSDKVKTIAGMEHIARRSELYFNLHTKGQTYFGDMRGQIHPVKN
ncbi:MAG: CHRD domain-containing protein [Blastocatellia bacterium]|nr:CHRD domain-containing protein [Blastocatellia bacterium]